MDIKSFVPTNLMDMYNPRPNFLLEEFKRLQENESSMQVLSLYFFLLWKKTEVLF
jgi:hypothetical protein